jgi:hypothetical protein
MIVLGSRGLSVCQHLERSHVLLQWPIHRFEGTLVTFERQSVRFRGFDDGALVGVVDELSQVCNGGPPTIVFIGCKFMIRACDDIDFLSTTRVIP